MVLFGEYIALKSSVKFLLSFVPAPTLFGTVICDPLWHMPYQKRPALAFMLRDHVKKGGRLILNALWIPKIKTMSDPVIYVGKNTMAWRNVSLILVYEKLEDGNSTSLGYPFEKEIPPCTPLQKN